MNATRYSTNSRSRRTVVGVALCATLALAGAPPARAAGGHLYQQVGSAIERFPLKDGIPQNSPDLTIAHYGGAIAVARDGTVYAMKLDRRGFNGYVIYAFPAGQTTPNRSIVLPRRAPCSLLNPPVQGLAVDAKGNLFVLIKYALSGAGRRWVPAGATFPICLGVAVYAPTASGTAKPIQAIPVSDYYFGGMAVSNRDALYVNLFDNAQTDEYTNAVNDPKAGRTIPAGINVGIATDRAGDAYMLDGSSGGADVIDVFAPSWISGPPTRTMQLQSPFLYPSAIAVRGPFLYLDEFNRSGPGAVGVFDATASGSVNPLGVLNLDHLVPAMAVGP